MFEIADPLNNDLTAQVKLIQDVVDKQVRVLADGVAHAISSVLTDDIASQLASDSTSLTFLSSHFSEVFFHHLSSESALAFQRTFKKTKILEMNEAKMKEIIKSLQNEISQTKVKEEIGHSIKILEKDYQSFKKQSEEENNELKLENFRLLESFKEQAIELKSSRRRIDDLVQEFEIIQRENLEKETQLDFLKQSFEKSRTDISVLDHTEKQERNKNSELREQIKIISNQRNHISNQFRDLQTKFQRQEIELSNLQKIYEHKCVEETASKQRQGEMMAQVERMLSEEVSESNATIATIHEKMHQMKSKLLNELKHEKKMNASLQEELNHAKKAKDDQIRDTRSVQEEVAILRTQLSRETEASSHLKTQIHELTNRLVDSKTIIQNSEIEFRKSEETLEMLKKQKDWEIETLESRIRVKYEKDLIAYRNEQQQQQQFLNQSIAFDSSLDASFAVKNLLEQSEVEKRFLEAENRATILQLHDHIRLQHHQLEEAALHIEKLRSLLHKFKDAKSGFSGETQNESKLQQMKTPSISSRKEGPSRNVKLGNLNSSISRPKSRYNPHPQDPPEHESERDNIDGSSNLSMQEFEDNTFQTEISLNSRSKSNKSQSNHQTSPSPSPSPNKIETLQSIQQLKNEIQVLHEINQSTKAELESTHTRNNHLENENQKLQDFQVSILSDHQGGLNAIIEMKRKFDSLLQNYEAETSQLSSLKTELESTRKLNSSLRAKLDSNEILLRDQSIALQTSESSFQDLSISFFSKNKEFDVWKTNIHEKITELITHISVLRASFLGIKSDMNYMHDLTHFPDLLQQMNIRLKERQRHIEINPCSFHSDVLQSLLDVLSTEGLIGTKEKDQIERLVSRRGSTESLDANTDFISMMRSILNESISLFKTKTSPFFFELKSSDPGMRIYDVNLLASPTKDTIVDDPPHSLHTNSSKKSPNTNHSFPQLNFSQDIEQEFNNASLKTSSSQFDQEVSKLEYESKIFGLEEQLGHEQAECKRQAQQILRMWSEINSMQEQSRERLEQEIVSYRAEHFSRIASFEEQLREESSQKTYYQTQLMDVRSQLTEEIIGLEQQIGELTQELEDARIELAQAKAQLSHLSKH